MGRMRSIIISLSLLCTSCNIGYLANQGYGHLKLMSKREPIEKILNNPEFGSLRKNKIELFQQVREFCEKDLGMKKTEAFKSFIKIEGPFVAYAVSACPKLNLKPYEWNFPIVGRMPYKGFFNKDDAIREKKLLEEKGYDTLLQGIHAYSTLGWFEDPILSSMLWLEDIDIVNLVIHELTHRNIFKKGFMDFNERVATFIGNMGTIMFFEKREGEGSINLSLARAVYEDEKAFSRFIKRSLEKLEALYSTDISNEEKLKKREKIFSEILNDFGHIKGSFKSGSYNSFGSQGINNALLLNHRRYIGNMEDLEKLFSCLGSDMKRFISTLREIVAENRDPDEVVSYKIISCSDRS